MEGEGERTTATKVADAATDVATTTKKGAMSNLPVGCRFHPTDEELVGFYLRSKREKREDLDRVIPVVDVFTLDPWQLPGESLIRDTNEWYFFSPMQEAPTGRQNRKTPSGYWKATGKDRSISSNNRVIGRKKTMVFYKGFAPRGDRTDWVLHEYKALEEPSSSDAVPKLRNECSVCRVFKKSMSLTSFDQQPTVTMTSGTTPNIDFCIREGDRSSSLGEISHQNPLKVARADSLSTGDHASHSLAEDSINEKRKMISDLGAAHLDSIDFW
ncbi:NAC domain-containing protein 90-like [Magnolia sinica]|uniref:NAC domain-containing protein 90-like n=1 Tax=Magnolia sinica TaxID=86752 RepID=UPI00265B151C|nr:NAC domain-containing protein 90-like [Magnolia sinica]